MDLATALTLHLQQVRKARQESNEWRHGPLSLYRHGTVFDSSRPRGRPLSFVIGIGTVIRAWDEGVARMCLGERAHIVAPPEFAYGEEGGGLVPPGATLYFDVELLQIGDEEAGSTCAVS